MAHLRHTSLLREITMPLLSFVESLKECSLNPKINVLLVAEHSLLSDGLEKLLADNADLCLKRATPSAYQNQLQQVYRHDPVVIIVEKETFEGKLAELVHLLTEYTHLQIIMISSESNELQIYASYQANITAVSDLLATIYPAHVLGK